MSHDPIRPATSSPAPLLSDADAAAVDAWAQRQGLEDGETPSGTNGGPRGDMCTTRVTAVERLLALLDDAEPVSSDADRRLLVDVTFARVLRARDEGAVARLAPTPAGPAVSDADARAIDELVETGWRKGRGDGRTQRVHALLSLIDGSLDSDGAERDRLVDAALARVQNEVDAETRRLRFTPVERPTYARPGIRWRDLGAIAAMFVIACSIFWPMVNGLSMGARRAQGEANMQHAALGFGLFANDHDDRLPARNDRGVDGLWWKVGTPQKSHSANLYRLVRAGYVPMDALASPGNPNAPTEVTDPEAEDWASSEQVSYSYQLFGKVVPHLATFDGKPGVVLADRSPIVERAMLGLPVNPDANSANQVGLGQLVLFANGRVRFLKTPELEDGDNIWLPRQLEQAAQPQVVGTELPASRADAFVGP